MESQYICNCVQDKDMGVILTQPNISSDPLPCQLTFKAHPSAINYSLKRVVVVSEAKHLELYVDDMYEKTERGRMLTLSKGR